MVDKRTRTSSFDLVGGVFESCDSFALGGYPKFQLRATPKVRRAPPEMKQASTLNQRDCPRPVPSVKETLGTDAASPYRRERHPSGMDVSEAGNICRTKESIFHSRRIEEYGINPMSFRVKGLRT
jgi:hypothetical protein